MEFYRYHEWHQTVGFGGHTVHIDVEEFTLVKETPKGYWIKHKWDHFNDHKRWVSKTARKRHAYPAKDEAWVNFKARKSKQQKILKNQLSRVEATCNHIKDMDNPPEKQEWVTVNDGFSFLE